MNDPKAGAIEAVTQAMVMLAQAVAQQGELLSRIAMLKSAPRETILVNDENGIPVRAIRRAIDVQSGIVD